MAEMAKAKIWWDFLEKRYWISFDYHQGFVDFLKAAIPKRARKYDPASRAWNFGRAYLAVVEAKATELFPDLNVEREPPRKMKARAPRTEVFDNRDFTVLEFFNALPRDAMKAAYKKAATLCHPDRGGTHEEMTYLNELWDRLQKDFYGAG